MFKPLLLTPTAGMLAISEVRTPLRLPCTPTEVRDARILGRRNALGAARYCYRLARASWHLAPATSQCCPLCVAKAVLSTREVAYRVFAGATRRRKTLGAAVMQRESGRGIWRAAACGVLPECDGDKAFRTNWRRRPHRRG